MKLRMIIVAIYLMTFTAVAVIAQDAPLSPGILKNLLADRPVGDTAYKLSERVRTWFGQANLVKGANPKIDGLDIAWAIDAPGARAMPKVVSADGNYSLPLERIPNSTIFVAAVTLPDGAGMRWNYDVDGKTMGGGQLEVYSTPTDNIYHDGVPKGTVKQMPKWKSTVFPNSERDWWIYVPAQ